MNSDAADVPTTEFEFALWLFNLRLDVQSDPNLSVQTRRMLEEQFDILDKSIRALEPSCAPSTLQTVAVALHAAVRIGAYYPDAPRTLASPAANKKRMRPAHAGRRRSDFQRIIDDASQACRSQATMFGDNSSWVARNIYPEVAAKVAQLSNPPKWWPPQKATASAPAETDDQAQFRRIGVIRKRIPATPRSDK